MRAHLWLAGFPKAAEEQADISVDCHRRLRGPYTGTAAVLRALVPENMARNPELARGHVIEILAMAPDLQALTGPAPDTLTTLAQGMERTRVYAAGRTRQLAHGIVDLITAYAEDRAECMLTLAFRNVDEADHTDQEFLAILLRRAGQRIRVIAGTRTDRLPADLLAALRAYARRVSQPPPVVSSDARDPAELLQAYIDSDGTSDDPAEIAAYRQADPSHRAALHDARAERLRREGEWGTQLGAIPYHLEHGADPGDAGGAALLEAARYAIVMGYYHDRGRGRRRAGQGGHRPGEPARAMVGPDRRDRERAVAARPRRRGRAAIYGSAAQSPATARADGHQLCPGHGLYALPRGRPER